MQRVFLPVVLLCAALAMDRAAAATVTVRAGINFFDPASLTIGIGDSVFFTNSAGAHSVTGYNPPSEPFCGPAIVGAGPMCTVTFNAPGTYQYRCIPHSFGSGTSFSGMVGSIIVTSPPTPPTVTLTNPPQNSLFAAPAELTLRAAGSGGNNAVITNVEFYANGALLGTDRIPPYALAISNVVAGTYTLSARVLASSGLTGTSAPVSVLVVDPPLLAPQRATNGLIEFSFNTVTGLNYIIQAATEPVTNWTALQTNRAASTEATYVETINAGPLRFYRVVVQP